MAEVIVIQSDLRKTEKQRLRVGAYARVSSNSLEQEDSFHNQVRNYTKDITSNPEWEFVDIYMQTKESPVQDRTSVMTSNE